MRERAFRRWQALRAKARAKHQLARWGMEGSSRWVGYFARTPATCSCWMCGNPRRHFGDRTRQEMLAERG